MKTLLPAAVCLAVAQLGGGCKDEPGSYEKGGGGEAPPKVVKKEAVEVIKPAVEWGKKVPCTSLIPDVSKYSAALGKQLVVADNTKSDNEAAAVCQLKLSGTPPSAKEQEKMWVKNNRVLGILPGDEVCQVTAYCSFIFDKVEEKKKCESNGDTASDTIGDLTCVRQLEAGAENRYVYTVLDPDSRCKLVINPGPSVTDEPTVKSCAKAAADNIGPANLKVQ
jgi:hypothetical protein